VAFDEVTDIVACDLVITMDRFDEMEVLKEVRLRSFLCVLLCLGRWVVEGPKAVGGWVDEGPNEGTGRCVCCGGVCAGVGVEGKRGTCRALPGIDCSL
jgi:hypothetical protein